MTWTGDLRLLFAARRRSRRILDVRFLGTPTFGPHFQRRRPLPQNAVRAPPLVQLDLLEHREPGIQRLAVASAGPLVQGLAAAPAQALALLAAQGIHRQSQQQLLAEDR